MKDPDDIDFHTVEAAVLLHAEAGLLFLQEQRLPPAKIHLDASSELLQWSRRAAARGEELDHDAPARLQGSSGRSGARAQGVDRRSGLLRGPGLRRARPRLRRSGRSVRRAGRVSRRRATPRSSWCSAAWRPASPRRGPSSTATRTRHVRARTRRRRSATPSPLDPGDARGAAASRQAAARRAPRDRGRAAAGRGRREGHGRPPALPGPSLPGPGRRAQRTLRGGDPLVPACPRGLARQPGRAARAGSRPREVVRPRRLPRARRRAPRSDPAAGRGRPTPGSCTPSARRGWRRPPSTASGTGPPGR